MKFDTSNAHGKLLLYNQFVAWYWKGCSIASSSNCANNPVFQELATQSEYLTSAHEKIFIDLRPGKRYTNKIEKLKRNDTDLTITIQLKTTAAKKMRLHVTGYFQGEYLNSLMREGIKKHALARYF